MGNDLDRRLNRLARGYLTRIAWRRRQDLEPYGDACDCSFADPFVCTCILAHQVEAGTAPGPHPWEGKPAVTGLQVPRDPYGNCLN